MKKLFSYALKLVVWLFLLYVGFVIGAITPEHYVNVVAEEVVKVFYYLNRGP